MADERAVVLTKLAHAQITEIHQETSRHSRAEGAELMDDFLDVVFDEIKHFPFQFPVCEGMRSGSTDYRMGNLYGGFKVIFQIFKTKLLVLMVVHEEELPF